MLPICFLMQWQVALLWCFGIKPIVWQPSVAHKVFDISLNRENELYDLFVLIFCGRKFC